MKRRGRDSSHKPEIILFYCVRRAMISTSAFFFWGGGEGEGGHGHITCYVTIQARSQIVWEKMKQQVLGSIFKCKLNSAFWSALAN